MKISPRNIDSIIKCLVLSIILLVLFSIYFVSSGKYRYNYKQFKLIKNESHRTFIHNKDELELTKVVKIMPNKCNDFQQISVFIHSAIKYKRRREIQRNTWVSDVKKHNISVYFAVGMSDNSIDEQNIRRESQQNRDIIQFGFIDSYYNNTLKAISILRWIHNHCNQSKLILKTDDDVLVNIELILENRNRFKSGIHGLLYRRVKPNRNKLSKWYMPQQFYNQTFYPVYNPGAAYLMSGDVINWLVTGIDSYSAHFIDIDDVFITGIIAKYMGIKRYYTNLIGKGGCSDKCYLYKFAAIFGCNKINFLNKIWFDWKNSTFNECFPKRFQKKLLINIRP